MATIVYGVSGEGSGHSSRALVIAGHLVEQGHTVKIVTYMRGMMNLEPHFDVFETVGLHITSIDNKVSILRTISDNLRKVPSAHPRWRALRKEVFETCKPDAVFCDFEPMTAYLASIYKVPLVSLDNQHRMRYMEYPYPPGLKRERIMTENVIRAMCPKPSASVVVSFYDGAPKNPHTFIMPPILREDIFGLEPRDDGHILVYMTSKFETLVESLHLFKRERFLVYGFEREGEEGNVTFKSFSREGFLNDLAGAKAIMGTAGFTLITESLYLGKPYLATPIRGQYEQMLNAYLLTDVMGYGKAHMGQLTPEVIGDFLYHLPDYREALKSYEPRDNEAIKARVDALLADDCAELKEHHRARRG